MVSYRMRLAALLMLALATIAACATASFFNTKLQRPDGSAALDVVVIDHTGLLRSIEPGTEEAADYGPVPLLLPDRAKNGFGVLWLGGACTDRVEISFSRTGIGYGLALTGHQPPEVTCDAIGIPRTVWLRFTEFVSYTTVVVSGREQ